MSLSKARRFEIFKRDGFVCQYCGVRPPDVVLEVDHIHPRSKGGDNDPLNLITSCGNCNRGKHARTLGNVVPRPDADELYLAAQQEIAEVKRYQKTLAKREAAWRSLIADLQDLWYETSGLDWAPSDKIIRKLLMRYSPNIVGQAIGNIAGKVGGGYLRGDDWIKYLFVTARNMESEGKEVVMSEETIDG